MIFIVVFIISVITGATLYRLRGGWLKDMFPHKIKILGVTIGVGTQASRFAWAIPTGLFMWYIIGGSWWVAVALILSNFFSMVMIGTGQYLVDVPFPRTPDILGIARTSIAAIPIAINEPLLAIVYALSGATHAHLYWLGFRTKWNSNAGECIVGGVCWAFICILMVLHAAKT